MATSPKESQKLDRIKKIHTLPPIWRKDRKNRSSRYWDSFAHSKKNKKEEINASIIYSPSGKFAERAK